MIENRQLLYKYINIIYMCIYIICEALRRLEMLVLLKNKNQDVSIIIIVTIMKKMYIIRERILTVLRHFFDAMIIMIVGVNIL